MIEYYNKGSESRVKKIIALFIMVLLLLCFVGCKENNHNQNNDNIGQDNDGQKEDEITYLTVTEAYNIALDAGEKGTEERKYVKGTVIMTLSISNGPMR